MKTPAPLLGAVAGLILGSAPPAFAHHGWSGYDAGQLITLTGSIREIGYESPHTHVRLEAAGKTWMIILAPPSRMTNRGIPTGLLKVGQTVEVQGYAHRTDRDEFRAERIVVDGKTVELR